MIKIKLDEKNECIFEIVYYLQEYIPQKYFDRYKQYIEVNFLEDLFTQDPKIKFLGKRHIIWTMHFDYEYDNKKFGMVLDEDYDIVSFFTEKSNDRKVISEYLVSIIEKFKQ